MNVKEFVNSVVENMYANPELKYIKYVKDGDCIIVWNIKKDISVVKYIDVPEITKTAENLLAKCSSKATDIKDFETFCMNLALIEAGVDVSREHWLEYIIHSFYHATETTIEKNDREQIDWCKLSTDYFYEMGYSANLKTQNKKNDHESPELKEDPVNHPKHYETDGIECIDAMLITQGAESVKEFCVCNAFKYLWRHNNKNNEEDIKKAAWYLNKYVDILGKGSKDVTDSCNDKCSNCTNCKGDKTK